MTRSGVGICDLSGKVISESFVSSGCVRAHPLGVAPEASKEWDIPLRSFSIISHVGEI